MEAVVAEFNLISRRMTRGSKENEPVRFFVTFGIFVVTFSQFVYLYLN
jgi:hypothetical protein